MRSLQELYKDMLTDYGRYNVRAIENHGIDQRIKKNVYMEYKRLKVMAHTCIGLDQQTLNEIRDIERINHNINGFESFSFILNDQPNQLEI